MDTKLIHEFGSEILSYRLRSARQRKRASRRDTDKRLLALYREEQALYRQKAALGWEPLIPPVQKGWKRFFVLREDVARSRHADFFGNILQKINTYDWSHRKDFKITKRRRSKKFLIVKPQSLKRLAPYEFHRIGFTEKERQFFHIEYIYERKGKNSVLVPLFVFSEPWRFKLRIRPNMIDKVRKRDAAIEARIQEIRDHMEKNDLRKRLFRMINGHYHWWYRDEKKKERYVLKDKSLADILEWVKE